MTAAYEGKTGPDYDQLIDVVVDAYAKADPPALNTSVRPSGSENPAALARTWVRGRCSLLPVRFQAGGGDALDVAPVMESLAEQGVTVLFKVDAERMRDGTKPWTLVANGAPFRDDLLVRTDAVSLEACLAVCLPRLREFGLVIPD
ncbi:hypothetical protein ACWCPI_34825 [Streptomyces sp. NPDC001920]